MGSVSHGTVSSACLGPLASCQEQGFRAVWWQGRWSSSQEVCVLVLVLQLRCHVIQARLQREGRHGPSSEHGRWMGSGSDPSGQNRLPLGLLRRMRISHDFLLPPACTQAANPFPVATQPAPLAPSELMLTIKLVFHPRTSPPRALVVS